MKVAAAILVSIILAPLFINGQSESPYELSLQTDLPVVTAAAGFSAFGFFLRSKIEVLTVDELERYDPEDINWFDRSATRRNSHTADVASDVLFITSAAGALSLGFDRRVRKDFLIVGVMFIETMGMVNGLTNITKYGVGRPRPLVYNPESHLSDKLKVSARLSFFSGHTSHTAALMFFTAKVFSDYHPDSKWKPVVWATAATIPAITGALRYMAGKHYPTDLIAGYSAGALIGFMVPHLHKKKDGRYEVVPVINGESAVLYFRYTF